MGVPNTPAPFLSLSSHSKHFKKLSDESACPTVLISPPLLPRATWSELSWKPVTPGAGAQGGVHRAPGGEVRPLGCSGGPGSVTQRDAEGGHVAAGEQTQRGGCRGARTPTSARPHGVFPGRAWGGAPPTGRVCGAAARAAGEGPKGVLPPPAEPVRVLEAGGFRDLLSLSGAGCRSRALSRATAARGDADGGRQGEMGAIGRGGPGLAPGVSACALSRPAGGGGGTRCAGCGAGRMGRDRGRSAPEHVSRQSAPISAPGEARWGRSRRGGRKAGV